MKTYRSFYEHELAKLIHVQIEEAKTTLAGGYVPDFPSYRELIGNIKGLQIAMELMAEADRICQHGEGNT